ncbi:MAG: MaoC/PaaZ C-terminal domain-containing protein [Actinomycetota bacterium]|nr:MaoC/PaaZ C-terminal domain-containing protein [Actinomycetota bacterium]
MTTYAVNPEAVGVVSGPVRRRWNSDDALLYAVGVGCDPENGLAFATENCAGIEQQTLPTFAIVLSSPLPMFDGKPMLPLWESLGEISWRDVVHGEQEIELFSPLPVEGEVESVTRVSAIWDKGSGAVVELETTSVDVATGSPAFRACSSIFVRGAGGWGGQRGPRADAPLWPDRAPDHVTEMRTSENQALIYRLSGDRNPLHCDPALARAAGFPRPILHGLCTFGFTARALIERVCGNESSRFSRMSGRFSAPVLPGEPLTVQMWSSGDGVLFRTLRGDGQVVLDRGEFVARQSPSR